MAHADDRLVAADIADDVRSRNDIALKAAGRRVIQRGCTIGPSYASQAINAYWSSWDRALEELDATWGKVQVDTALKRLGIERE